MCPIYDFKCDDHEEVLEKLLSFSEYDDFKAGKLVFKCKECEKEMKRQVSLTNFHLKGGGWHADLYSKTGGKK